MIRNCSKLHMLSMCLLRISLWQGWSWVAVGVAIGDCHSIGRMPSNGADNSEHAALWLSDNGVSSWAALGAALVLQ